MELCEEDISVDGGSSKLSPQALDSLRSLDSLTYGLLGLNCSNGRANTSIGGVSEGGGGRESVHRTPITRDIIKQGITHLRGSVAKLSYSPHSQAQLISQIAHLHLLLDEFTHAYSAYTQYQRLSPPSETDPALFYGLGIIYHHYGQHKQAEEAYTKVLSLSPSFPRSGEVHFQLGLLLQRRRAYEEAVAHFEKALNKHDPQLDIFLIQFHMAHVLELQGCSSRARSKYEVLLGCRTLSQHVKALTQKQLGWLLHRCPSPGGKGVRERALELLKQAAQSLPECGETWYLLGRVLVTHQKYHEAFSAYQKTIHCPSKISPANTWHSIGHLYFQMQQPRDSLQAYLCCVYLDIHHLQGWKSLGCLYEAVVYPLEALLCYQNAMIAFAKKAVNNGKDIDYVRSRIDALNQYLCMVGGKPLTENPGMPLLHEAWTKLIPQHIRKTQPNPGTPILSLNQFNNQPWFNHSNVIPTLPYPPCYPPVPVPLTPITPASMAGAMGNGNIMAPLSFDNGNKPPLMKKTKKKSPVARISSGSTPSPPVSTPHSTPTQNWNGNITNACIDSDRNRADHLASSCISHNKSSPELDLDGINLDNLDFDALTAAASAIPSPASLAARSRVKVSTTKQQETATTSSQLQRDKPHTPCSSSASSIVSLTHISNSLSMQAPVHKYTGTTTKCSSVRPQSLIPSLTSPHRPLSSPSLLFSTLASPTTSLSNFNLSTTQSTCSSNSFSMGHTNSEFAGLQGHSIPSSLTQSLNVDSAMSLIGTSSGSHTPDTASSHQSTGNTFNWPSYLMAALQQPNKPTGDSLQLQSMTTKLPSSSSSSSSLSTTGQSLSSILSSSTPLVTSPVQPHPLHPGNTITVSPTTLARSQSQTEERNRRKSLDRTHKRRSSSSSYQQSKVTQRRRRSENGTTNNFYPSPMIAAPPSIRLQAKLDSTNNSDLSPLPPNMTSDPSLLSLIQLASHSSIQPPTGVIPGESNSHHTLPSQTTGNDSCIQSDISFGLNGYNHKVSQLQSPQNAPQLGHDGTYCTKTKQIVPTHNMTTATSINHNGSLGHNQSSTTIFQNVNSFDLNQMNPALSTTTLASNSHPQPTPFTTNIPNTYCGNYGHNQTSVPLHTTVTSGGGYNHSNTVSNPPHSGTDHHQTPPHTTISYSYSMPYSTAILSNSDLATLSCEHLTTKRSRLSSHATVLASTQTSGPTNVPMYTSQSSSLHNNSHQDHHHKDHTHKVRQLSQSGKASSKTIHHFSPRTPNSSPSLPAATFIGLPLFSPPPPSSHQQPQLSESHIPQVKQLTTSLTPNSNTTATTRIQHTVMKVQNESPLTLQTRQTSSIDPTANIQASLYQPISQAPLTQQQQIPPHVEQTQTTDHRSPMDLMPDIGPTLTILSANNASNEPTQLPFTTSNPHPPTPGPVPQTSSNQPPPTSVESLVNHLFSVLQQKNGSVDKVVHSPSNSSSGISSGGTKISTISTAASSPQSVPTPSYFHPSLSPHHSSSIPPSFHPSLDHLSAETITSPSMSTTLPVQSPHSSQLQQSSSFGTSHNYNDKQTMTNGTKNEPVLYHNNHDHQPSNQLHNIYDRLNNNESSQNNSANKIIAPRVPFPSLASMEEYMILEPELRPPSPPPFHSGIDLRPDCPLYKVTSYEDAISSSLLEFCYNPSNPICLIRGIVEAVGLDLNLFSSQCLVETSSDHDMEVREQMKQEADENCDVVSGKQVWKCDSSKSITTVSEYARYQQKILHKEIEERNNVCVSDNGQGEKKEREFLSFGTNVDISDEKIWSHQLQELHKLPQFLRVTCPETNLLSHVGHTVLGMNSVQLYMKVAGSRTPGHQENNNFCSLNINIGPGTCEWFAVPNSYWGVLHTLCEKHKVNFLVGSWWPVLEELYQHKVPVYRFTQYKGDVVFINPGTVHWVQANSTCNNIAWNTGPLTAHQFRMAWERYQWNKVQSVRSIVPMIHLTWNLARHIRVTDTHFYSQVRSLLESSLDQTNLLLSHLQKAGIPVVWHGRLDGEPAPYCSNCMEEVFNILFVLSQRGEYLVYCHRCAGSMRKTFTVLQQYQSKDLEEVVTSFRLYPPEL